jgi:hypothetical protein
MNPFEKYDMTFNGAVASRLAGQLCGARQRIDLGADHPDRDRVQQVDRGLSEHQANSQEESRTTGDLTFKIQTTPYLCWI